MATMVGQQIKVWFNGTVVDTEQARRAHGAGTYQFYVESFDKTQQVSATIVQFAVYKLTTS
jgi:hypothetical protein